MIIIGGSQAEGVFLRHAALHPRADTADSSLRTCLLLDGLQLVVHLSILRSFGAANVHKAEVAIIALIAFGIAMNCLMRYVGATYTEHTRDEQTARLGDELVTFNLICSTIHC